MRTVSTKLLTISTALSVLTIISSLSISYFANGYIFSTVKIPLLRDFGGTTFEDLHNLELWRLATAQLIHAKQPHMLLNVLFLFFLGNLVESKLGGVRMLFIWLLAGGIATALSPVFVDPPWNVGTGASQATFAFAGSATILVLNGALKQKSTTILIACVVVSGFGLDLIYGGYPKPGHVAGYVLGLIFGDLSWKHRKPVTASI